MQTAQHIIRNYRRRRITLALSLAVLTFLATLGVRFLTIRSVNLQRVDEYGSYAVATMENLLSPHDELGLRVAPLVGKPCNAVQGELRQYVARARTLRAISLIKNGILYCSSVFGNRAVPVNMLEPTLPSRHASLQLSVDNSLLKGSPVLVKWTSVGDSGLDGAMQVINIALLTQLMSAPEMPWVVRTALNVGDNHLVYGSNALGFPPPGTDDKETQFHSARQPFSISLIGPSASTLAVQRLPSQVPLALLLALLIGYMAWQASASRMSFSREITLGIARGEFEIWCQPLVHAQTHACTGVELLLRWNNPRQGWISPDIFIPLAEQENLIVPLTRYVIDRTIKHIDIFPASSDFHIGINVAADHFRNGLILNDLKRYWFACRPSQRLMLELTEREDLQHLDPQVFRQLRALGVRLAIDDFGTGRSSLAWLEMLKPDVLKIDKSFTAAIGTDSVNSRVISMIIELGQRLGITLVAEGVETALQEEYLRRQQVQILQGWLFARPMPPGEFPAWLERHQRLSTPGQTRV
jgi:sensor c-di-GMP phosphodiesterase-like protein